MKKQILFLLLLNCVFSCKKDPTYPDERISVPQVLLDYGYFQKGTYWIYQDSTSLDIDSVYVTSSQQSTFITTPDPSRPYHGYFGTYDVYSKSSFDGMQYHYSVETATSFNGPCGIVEDRMNNMNYGTETWLMTDYFVSGQTFLSDPSYTYAAVVYENQYDSLKVLNTYFKNVMLFRDGKNATQNNSVTNTYIAKNIGIIRKEYLNFHEVWNLIRYHIQ